MIHSLSPPREVPPRLFRCKLEIRFISEACCRNIPRLHRVRQCQRVLHGQHIYSQCNRPHSQLTVGHLQQSLALHQLYPDRRHHKHLQLGHQRDKKFPLHARNAATEKQNVMVLDLFAERVRKRNVVKANACMNRNVEGGGLITSKLC